MKDTIECSCKILIQHPVHYALYLTSQWLPCACVHIFLIYYIKCKRRTLK